MQPDNLSELISCCEFCVCAAVTCVSDNSRTLVLESVNIRQIGPDNLPFEDFLRMRSVQPHFNSGANTIAAAAAVDTAGRFAAEPTFNTIT